MMSSSLVGVILDNRYRLAALLSAEGESVWYCARDLQLERHVAIKITRVHRDEVSLNADLHERDVLDGGREGDLWYWVTTLTESSAPSNPLPSNPLKQGLEGLTTIDALPVTRAVPAFTWLWAVGATAIVFVLAFLFTLALRPSATPPPTPTVEPTFVVTPLVLQLAPTYTLPPQIPDMPRATFVPQPSKTAIPAPNPTATPPPIGLSVGATAPDFRLKDLFGVEQQLAAQRGKLVAINFWATWCNPCREEMPALQRAYELHKNRGFLVWGVNAGESTAQAQRFVGEIQVNFPLLLDGDSRTTRLYRVFALPSTFFVDRNGVIQQVVVGAMDERTLESHLKRLLN